jgi:hypothetical protein
MKLFSVENFAKMWLMIHIFRVSLLVIRIGGNT